MVQRMACTLEPDDIRRACESEAVSDGKPDEDPQANGPATSFIWKDEENNYRPNYNMAPGTYAPVMLAAKQLNESASANDRLITPMRWGFIPEWFDKDPEEFEYRTFNCQLESLTEPEKKGLFKKAFNTGKRCVAVIDGFYEWKKTGSRKAKDYKQPYFFCFPQQRDGFDWMKQNSEANGRSQKVKGKELEWTGPRLLTVAGVYDIAQKGKLLSFATITVDASKAMAWCHDRMPAILDGEEAISAWLDVEGTSPKDALKWLEPSENLTWHKVSKVVDDAENNSIECIRPLANDDDTDESDLQSDKESPKSSKKKKSARAKSPRKKYADGADFSTSSDSEDESTQENLKQGEKGRKKTKKRKHQPESSKMPKEE